MHGLHRRESGRLDCEAEPRGEADGAQHAQMILFEPLRGIADGADDAIAEIGESTDVIDDMARGIVQVCRIEQEALMVKSRRRTSCFGSVSNSTWSGMAAVPIRVVAAECGHFHPIHQHYAELRAHQLSLGE